MNSIRTGVVTLIAFAAIGVSACYHVPTVHGGPYPKGDTTSAAPTQSNPTLPVVQPNGVYRLPNKTLSPGSTEGGGTFNQICPHVDPTLESERPTSAEKAKVYQAYGLSYPQYPTGKYELDHVIPIELGGAPDMPANEFPELNSPPDPLMLEKWGISPAFAHNPKDILEDALHQLVCSGQVDLVTAQQAIATDWVSAYDKYVVNTDVP